ncbi:uncharacterized protein LOC119023680 [Acanthopagrus latus]|uniref:uncharacterized protein LOC119023680 n=1 Tax=Acanthopagrus latus TaxID=8177 RepID=UPI00187BCA80|nr:uncharacterized protein LOC119023680 [Acanthopagrus latus]
MAHFVSEQFLTEREEICLFTLVFRSAVHRNEAAGGYEQPRRRLIKMEVSNLRSYAVSDDQIKSLAACLPSLQCGPRTGEENFDQMWCQESCDVHRFGETSQLNTPQASAGAAGTERRRKRRRRRPHQPYSSLLVTPVHPEQIDIQALANSQNHFNMVNFQGMSFVRVTSSVRSLEMRQSQRKWRVSDYNLEGQKILSVICTMTADMNI